MIKIFQCLLFLEWVLYQGVQTFDYQPLKFTICVTVTDNAKIVGKWLPSRKLLQLVSPDSAIVRGIKHRGKNDCDTVTKL